MNMLKRYGDKILPWRVPLITLKILLVQPFHLTTAFSFLYHLYNNSHTLSVTAYLSLRKQSILTNAVKAFFCIQRAHKQWRIFSSPDDRSLLTFCCTCIKYVKYSDASPLMALYIIKSILNILPFPSQAANVVIAMLVLYGQVFQHLLPTWQRCFVCVAILPTLTLIDQIRDRDDTRTFGDEDLLFM